MSPVVSIVAVSGSLHSPSKTTVLAAELLAAFADSLGSSGAVEVETHLIELSDVGREFSGALTRDELKPLAADAIRRIESATLLIVASPVYRASFTGLFKHVFDFVGQYSLIDTPVLLAATGGSDRHALIIDHQFRPLGKHLLERWVKTSISLQRDEWAPIVVHKLGEHYFVASSG